MKQNKYSDKFFSTSKYVLWNSAFEPSNICIPAYKTDAGYYQAPEKMKFNKALSPPRVITEHTMGLWKGRIPWLRNIRMRITNNPELLKWILRYIDATVVLHNMLDQNDEDMLWNIEEETLSDIGDVTRVPERDCLDLPLPAGSLPGTRREQLKQYINETWFPFSMLQDM